MVEVNLWFAPEFESHIPNVQYLSAGQKAFAKVSGVRASSTRFVSDKDQIVLNWGNAGVTPPLFKNTAMWNPPEAVESTLNKLPLYMKLRSSPMSRFIPDTAFDKSSILSYVERGLPLVNLCPTRRTKMVTKDDLTKGRCPSIVSVYTPTKKEYRVHAHNGKVFLCESRNFGRVSVSSDDWRLDKLRSESFFEPISVDGVPKEVQRVALDCLSHLGLTFGSATVGWRPSTSTAVIFGAKAFDNDKITDYFSAIFEVNTTSNKNRF